MRVGVGLLLGLLFGMMGRAESAPGDLNRDRQVNIQDVVGALHLALGLRTPTAADLREGDVYPVVGLEGRRMGDGRLTVEDAVRILRHVSGAITLRDLQGEARVMTLSGSGKRGWLDGPGASASFYEPWTLTMGGDGAVYVVDAYNSAIRKVAPDGEVLTVAGDRSAPGKVVKAGYEDGPADEARFHRPQAVAVAPDGTLYVADTGNHAIRQVRNGEVTTLAGNGRPGYRDGSLSEAQFREPQAVAVGPDGIYVGDTGNHCIRRISFEGGVSTVAGSTTRGFVDGPAHEARFLAPAGLVFDGPGNLYIADCSNVSIRRLSVDGQVTTYAGDGHTGGQDGPRRTARFTAPMGIDLDEAGNLYVADWGTHTIRRITADGWVHTIAGSSGVNGLRNGPGAVALFLAPMGIAVDRKRNVAYVADTDNQRIRKIELPQP
jgi:sugar lactone lactonase YvrE